MPAPLSSAPPPTVIAELASRASGITCDSRQVRPGYVYVAMPGAEKFVEEAWEKGAMAVIRDSRIADREEPITHHESRITVVAENPRLALSQLAALFYPRQPAHIAAITGTDGKTSTADFFRQLAGRLGHKAASIGTLGVIGAQGEMLVEGTHTTPDPVTLHRILQELADSGVTHAALEASSHGLHQHRMDGVRIEAAAFSNLGRDHLDYHADVEDYFSAKARLFSELLPLGGTAVLNADDARFAALTAMTKARILAYGRAAGAELRIDAITPVPDGQDVSLTLCGVHRALHIKLVGAFQVYNMLAACGLLIAMGEQPEALIDLLPKLGSVPGRMEQAAPGVYVDYAHTPQALAGALTTLRPHTQGKLHVVFGAGGDRDRGKRPEMGAAAAALADCIIVTDDNPRSENPAAIRDEIMAACPRATAIADRREAIYAAVAALAPGDVLLVAGKGHEKTQTVNGVAYPFDDIEVVREVLVREVKEEE